LLTVFSAGVEPIGYGRFRELGDGRYLPDRESFGPEPLQLLEGAPGVSMACLGFGFGERGAGGRFSDSEL
jgi:hypothetical protein